MKQRTQEEYNQAFNQFMFYNVDNGVDIDEYNQSRELALHMYGTVAAAYWDMSGKIKAFNIDNSFGRYGHKKFKPSKTKTT